jgi:tetratricopeptide (TPR) repeat protein
MKILRKYCLFIAIVCVAFQLSGQVTERKKANLPVIGEPVSILENADGWALQDNGIWLKGNNCIPNSNADVNRTNDPENKLGRHNFKKLELREVIIGGEQYMVLIFYSKAGKFEFETLREGWNDFESVAYYVFKAIKIKELLPDTAVLGKPFLINLDIFCSDHIENYDKHTYIPKIANHIQRTFNSKIKNHFNLLLSILPVNSSVGKVVRIRFIEVYNKKSIYQRYFIPETMTGLLNKYYYEIPYAEFSRFTRTVPVFEDLIGNPQTFTEFFKRGMALYKRSDYKAAVLDFERAGELAAADKPFLVYAYLGSCYHELADYSHALEYFDKAIENKPVERELIPDWAKAMYNRGVTRFAIDDKNGACDDWNKAEIYGVPEAVKMMKKHCK